MEIELKKTIDILLQQKKKLTTLINKEDLNTEKKFEIINKITELDELLNKYYIKIKNINKNNKEDKNKNDNSKDIKVKNMIINKSD